MSIKAMTWVWDNADYSGSKLLMLLAIADHCNDDGVCFPGVSRLAKKCRVSKRTAQRLIKELQTEGVIYVEENAGIEANGGKTNKYYLVAYCDKNGIDYPRDKAMSPRVTHDTTPRDIRDTTPRDKAMSPKPSVEPSEESSNTPHTPQGVEDWLLAELKEFGVLHVNYEKVADALLGRGKRNRKQYNIQGEPIAQGELMAFAKWWDAKGIARPTNMTTLPGHIVAWRNDGGKDRWQQSMAYQASIEAYRQTLPPSTHNVAPIAGTITPTDSGDEVTLEDVLEMQEKLRKKFGG